MRVLPRQIHLVWGKKSPVDQQVVLVLCIYFPLYMIIWCFTGGQSIANDDRLAPCSSFTAAAYSEPPEVDSGGHLPRSVRRTNFRQNSQVQKYSFLKFFFEVYICSLFQVAKQKVKKQKSPLRKFIIIFYTLYSYINSPQD